MAFLMARLFSESWMADGCYKADIFDFTFNLKIISAIKFLLHNIYLCEVLEFNIKSFEHDKKKSVNGFIL